MTYKFTIAPDLLAQVAGDIETLGKAEAMTSTLDELVAERKNLADKLGPTLDRLGQGETVQRLATTPRERKDAAAAVESLTSEVDSLEKQIAKNDRVMAGVQALLAPLEAEVEAIQSFHMPQLGGRIANDAAEQIVAQVVAVCETHLVPIFREGWVAHFASGGGATALSTFLNSVLVQSIAAHGPDILAGGKFQGQAIATGIVEEGESFAFRRLQNRLRAWKPRAQRLAEANKAPYVRKGYSMEPTRPARIEPSAPQAAAQRPAQLLDSEMGHQLVADTRVEIQR
jgi:hypothetical protein